MSKCVCGACMGLAAAKGWLPLREAAERYADGLVIGDSIIDETDGPVIATFRHLLPGVLAKRGLHLIEGGPGRVIVQQAPWATRVEPPQEGPVFRCRPCGANWFSCGCVPESYILAISWPDAGNLVAQLPKLPARALA